jgi:Tfp pilus assembly protein PilO
MISSNRLWVIGSVTVMLIALVAGWFIGAQPFIAAAAKDDADRASIEAQNIAQQATIGALTEENKDLSTIETEFHDLQKSIPGTPSTAAFIQSINDLGDSAGVQVAGITVGESIAYSVPQSVAAAAAAVEAAATPSPENTAAPTAPVADLSGYVVATDPLITPSNFVGIKIGIDLKGPYSSVLAFVKGLQSGSRLVLVTGFTSNTDTVDSSDVTAHVDGMLYVLKQGG